MRKVPGDVWGIIFEHAIHADADRCTLCSRPFVTATRNSTARSIQLVCRSWRWLYKWKYVMRLLRTDGCFAWCAYPARCLLNYATKTRAHFSSAPPLPFHTFGRNPNHSLVRCLNETPWWNEGPDPEEERIPDRGR